MARVARILFNWYLSREALPYWCILMVDCSLVLLSGYIAVYFDIGGFLLALSFWPYTRGLLIAILTFILFFRLFHTYSGILRFSSFVDLRNVAYAALSASLCVYLESKLFYVLGWEYILIPRGRAVALMGGCSLLLMLIFRVLSKSIFENPHLDDNARKAFIYGIMEGGVALAKSIKGQLPRKYELAGFVAPGSDMFSEYLMGVPVYHDDSHLVSCMQKVGAQVLIVSPLQVEHFRGNSALVSMLIAADIKILMMPDAEEWDGKSELQYRRLREVEIEDLLPRDPINLNMDAIAEQIREKRILITGAAGSIGQELVRQVAAFHPERMILIDQAETPMHDIRLMMAKDYAYIKAITLVASITDRDLMETVFAENRPDYVFHAAAYKHVPMMEDNPVMAVTNNVHGTRIIADLAVRYGTQKFVMISTDKAVNPTNVMGCSKRICEIYCQSLNGEIARVETAVRQQDGQKAVTQFITTRFGNVLGSNGSVIPIFKEQIKKGGPITVTHPSIIRYFMLIPEACKLVLEAGTMGNGGEIFAFDMGQPVKIVDLAKRMIALSGAKDIEIQYTGLRDGEKLYEEVLASSENTMPTTHPKIKVAKVREYDYKTACDDVERLMQMVHTYDNMAIVKEMKRIVPEYKSKHSIYEKLD